MNNYCRVWEGKYISENFNLYFVLSTKVYNYGI